MENIIWQSDSAKMYIKFSNKYFSLDTPKPFASFIIGVELKFESCIGGEILFHCEEGFNMIGKKLLTDLKKQSEFYVDKEIMIKDALGDTDGYVKFECKPDYVEVTGQLGATFSGTFVQRFKFKADSSILVNLYETLKENAIY